VIAGNLKEGEGCQRPRRAHNRPLGLGGPAPYDSFAVTKRIATIDEAISLNGMHLLDLGCGNGSYTGELARRACWVCGLDIQMSNLQQVRTPLPLVQGVGERLPFASESFDGITMIEVLEHTASDSEVLKECLRVLKPGGHLILFVPNKLYPFESHPCHVGNLRIGRNIPLVSWLPSCLHRRVSSARIYTRRRITRMAKTVGFRVQRIGYILPPLDTFPLPFKATYRRVSRSLERTPLRVFGVSIFLVLQSPERDASRSRKMA